jgi:hypothetical protein
LRGSCSRQAHDKEFLMKHYLYGILALVGIVMSWPSHADVPVSIEKRGTACTQAASGAPGYGDPGVQEPHGVVRCSFWIPARAFQNENMFAIVYMKSSCRSTEPTNNLYLHGDWYSYPTQPEGISVRSAFRNFTVISQDGSRAYYIHYPPQSSWQVEQDWPRTLVLELMNTERIHNWGLVPYFHKDCVDRVHLVTRQKR